MGPGSGGSPLWACETSHLDGPVPAEGVGGWVGSILLLVVWCWCLLLHWPASVVLCCSAPGIGL